MHLVGITKIDTRWRWMPWAVLAPFFLYGWFQRGIGGLGLQIDPVYKRLPLQRISSVIQISWASLGGTLCRL